MAKFGDQRIKVGEYSNGRAKYVTRRHYAKIKMAEKRLGYPITVVQGSYHTGVPASAGTHDKGGCLDLAPFEWKRKCRVFRELGDTAWHRTAIPDVWNEHIHTVDLGCSNLAHISKQQVKDYRNKLDGLKHPKPDPQWRPDPIPSFKLTLALISTLWPQRKVPTGPAGGPEQGPRAGPVRQPHAECRREADPASAEQGHQRQPSGRRQVR